MRLKEHIVDLKHNRFKKSVLVEHAHNTGHQICLEYSKIIATLDHQTKRKIREMVKIKLHRLKVNRDKGTAISETWNLILHILASQ